MFFKFRDLLLVLTLFSLAFSGCTAGGVDVPQPPVGGGVSIPAVELPAAAMPEMPEMPAAPGMPDFSAQWA